MSDTMLSPMPDPLNDTEFDHALIASAFEQAGLRGWGALSIADAARDAGLPLARARARFPGRDALLLRFGVMADQAALAGDAGGDDVTPRERLFDLLMQRFDAMQPHRDGMSALLRTLPADPATGLLLYSANLRSMKWMLDGAGIPSGGVVGALRVHGLLAVWVGALRAWERDDSPDLSGTMAALDRGLDRAVRAEGWLPGRGGLPSSNLAGRTPEERMAEALADVPVEDMTEPAPPPDKPARPSPDIPMPPEIL